MEEKIRFTFPQSIEIGKGDICFLAIKWGVATDEWLKKKTKCDPEKIPLNVKNTIIQLVCDELKRLNDVTQSEG